MTSLILALLLLAPAEPLVIDTSSLEDGKEMFVTHDGVNIRIVRMGERRHVLIEQGARKDEITIEKEGNRLRVGSVVRRESFLVRPQRIIVDGVPIEPFADNLLIPAGGGWGRPQTYVCPKDETVVKVPHANRPDPLKCPVDGAVMLPRGASTREYHLLSN